MQVIIRPLQELDAYTSVKWRNDPEVFRYTGNTYNHEITIESELDWINKIISNQNEYRCAILADGLYVGNIYLTDIDGISANYHIFIGNKDFWGKGVAKEASIQILEYAFNVRCLKEVRLRVRKDNNSAYNLYMRLGFKEEFTDGNWVNMCIKSERCLSRERTKTV